MAELGGDLLRDGLVHGLAHLLAVLPRHVLAPLVGHDLFETLRTHFFGDFLTFLLWNFFANFFLHEFTLLELKL